MIDRAVKLIPPYLRVGKRAIHSWMRGEPELHLVPALCSRSEWSIDIGANNGVYAWHIARHSAGVIAFEPQPSHAGFLVQAFGPRVRVEQVALSDSTGEAVLRVPQETWEDGRATIEASNTLDRFTCAEYTVPRRRLDSYDLPPVGFMKIDVEGHELAVLGGAEAILRRDRPNLIIEAEERHRPGAVASVRDFLAALGYRAHVLRNGELSRLDGEAAPDGTTNYIFLARPNAAALRAS